MRARIEQLTLLYMSMLGFIYLILILGWIMIVLFLKCKRTITPRFAFTDTYADAMRTDRRPSVHVIQLQPDDVDQEDEQLERYHRRSNHLRRHPQRSQQSQDSLEANNNTHTIETSYPTDAVINPAFTPDEYIINAPPPSYDDVMRQPEVYPKVHQAIKSSEANI